jgi:hypothetical protein
MQMVSRNQTSKGSAQSIHSLRRILGKRNLHKTLSRHTHSPHYSMVARLHFFQTKNTNLGKFWRV